MGILLVCSTLWLDSVVGKTLWTEETLSSSFTFTLSTPL